LVSKDRSYKPVVKSSGGKRESDGAVVPASAGKDSDFGHADRGDRCKGMTGTARSNLPDGYALVVNVPHLRSRLWATAKSPVLSGDAVLDPEGSDFPLVTDVSSRRTGDVTMSRRPSVSRVRENRTHGLKGEWGTGPATAPRP
jgi:hypothetical protein